ncbi:MAG: response regulator transcription factor [Proteobacteria bacterium]|nr:response regulator transcription factor [Pseudomonadota bacterium]
MPRKVLVIEDHTDIAEVVALHLSDIDCEVRHVANGLEGLRVAESERHDLIILDLMLPGMDGLEICRRVRAKNRYVPILMLTAKSSEADRVVGLELGADDYLTKPFSVMELLARVKALFRRVEALTQARDGDTEVLHARGIVIDTGRRAVSVGGGAVELTAKEFDLLLQFAKHPGRVYTRAQLLDLVWGYGHAGYEHTVNSHINRLRAKIERDPAKPAHILTVWGVGYKFNDAAAA